MSRRGYSLTLVAAVLVAAVCFLAGRFGVGARESAAREVARTEGKSAAPMTTITPQVPEAASSQNATIENIGRVAFDQGYRFLRTATAEQLAQWVTRLEALPTSPRKTAGIGSFFRILAQVDTKKAVELAMKMEGREARSTAMQAVFAATPEANVAELVHLGIGLDRPDSPWDEFISRWSMTDPVAASRFAKEHPLNVQTEGLQNLLRNWAAIDPAAARGWLEELEPAKRTREVYTEFFVGWFDHDRETAGNYFVAHAAEEEVKEAIGKVAETLFRESPEATLGFLLRFPETEKQKIVVEGVVGPVRAIYLSGKQPYSDESVAKWLVRLPEEISGETLGAVVTRWSRQSPEAAADWLREMPIDRRDRVAASICQDFYGQDPHSNIRAGFEIVDRALREKSLRAFLEKFDSQEGAREAVQTANLAPSQRAELEAIIRGL